MAQCHKTTTSFVRDVFNPYVGVICSNEANLVCQKNHLSFVELLLPFARLSTEAHIRDPSGHSTSLKDFAIQIKDGTSQPPQQTVGLRMLSEAVGTCHNSSVREKTVTAGDYEISCPISTPWYEEYRECFLSIALPSEHEFLRHYTACLFVVSSTHPDPMNQFTQMSIAQHQQQQQTPSRLPYWFSPDICKYYILLHDCMDGDDSRAEAVYQSMKAKYGVHSCHLLKINSVTPNLDASATEMLPDPWSNFLRSSSSDSSYSNSEPKVNGDIPNNVSDPLSENSITDHPLSTVTPQSPRERHHSGGRRRPRTRSISERGCCLSTHDHERLKILVYEFVIRALIPWAERIIRSLNELYLSKKKGGFLKSIFNRARVTDSKPTTTYQFDSSEMQLRRLADLCFMFQLYDTAYGVYHLLKKDFESDKAWMYCAGTQEMAGLSVFMQGPSAQRQYPTHYLDGAINVYNSCRSQSFMTRAVLLSTEVLKEKGLWLQAATQLLKLTGEEHDLRSAVLLEQAAYCYINMKPPQIRKFAFYLVLAGHRYSKANQKKHSLRCYHLALQVYDKKEWRLAEDHIEITTARLSNQLKEYQQALTSMSKLLVDSTQAPAQQAIFLKEYLQLYATLVQQGVNNKHLPEMSVPKIVDNEIMVTTETFDMATNSSVYSDDLRWAQLEEACVIESQGSLPLVLQRSIPSYNKFMKNTSPPRSIINEMQYLRVLLHNPLRINIKLTDITLEWRFKPKGEDNFTFHSHEHPEVVIQQPVSAMELPGQQKQWLLFRFVPKVLGFLNLTAISYQLSSKDTANDSVTVVKGRLVLHVHGQRLNSTKSEMNSVIYSPDKRLFLNVTPPMPKVKAVFQSFPTSMQCGEIVKISVTITNVGPISLSSLLMTCNEPALITVPVFTEGSHVTYVRKVIQLGKADQVLEPSESLSFDMWLRADEFVGTRPINFVIYYQSAEDNSDKPRHRCSRHSFILTTVQVIDAKFNVYERTVRKPVELGSHLLSLLLHNCSPTSQQAVMEFAITDILCQSQTWEIGSLSDETLGHVKVNQSEVALLNASIKYASPTGASKFSILHLNSEQTSIDLDVVQKLMQNQSLKCQPDEEDSEDGKTLKKTDAEIAVLWKGFTMNAEGETTQSVGLVCLSVNVKDELNCKQRTVSRTGVIPVLEFPKKSDNEKLPDQSLDTDHVEYHLEYDSHVKTDLEAKRLEVIPVNLVIQSYYSNPVTMEIAHINNCTGLIWSGKTKSTVTLSPEQVVNVQLGVTVFKYGVYNLSALEIKSTDSRQIKLTGHMPPLLIVEKG